MKEFVCLSLLLLSIPTHAAPVTWHLLDAVFDDGGLAAGIFTYDADTNLYSDITVSVTVGSNSSFSDTIYEYTGAATTIQPNKLLGAAHPIINLGDSLLDLIFSTNLTNSGGIVSLEVFPSGKSGERINNLFGVPTPRYFVSGSVSAVPVPAAVWLFSSAFACLGWLRREQVAKV